MGLFTRSIRPPDETPNLNDPVTASPGTVGPPNINPGDPHGVTVAATDPQYSPPPPRIVASPWSGWPADWWPPNWSNSGVTALADTAWMCIDKNSKAVGTMPPYLVGAAPSLSADWLLNPDPDIYASWEEFLRSLFWDYQAVGEAFVYATARYSTGWPVRFHVVPPWAVNVEMDHGSRRYRIGSLEVTGDLLHIRYQSSVSDAHGHGPLEAGQARLTAAEVLSRYATNLAAGGGIPSSVLEHPEELTAEQSALLQAQWVQARLSSIGEPAVLSGGVTWTPTQINPKDMALLELSQFTESRIAVLLGVPPFLVGLPSGGDSMTYSTTVQLFDYHWRDGLRPMAQMVMSALSGWLLPRGTRVELNRDEYVQPGPLERAQTDQILNAIVDPRTGQAAKTVAEIRDQERFDDSTPEPLSTGVLQ